MIRGNLIITTIFLILAFLAAACSGGGGGLSDEEAIVLLKSKLGDPYYRYLTVVNIKPDSEIGVMLKKAIKDEVFIFEWGDVRKVYIPNKPEASDLCRDEVYIHLNGTLSCDIAIQQVFMDEVKKVKTSKTDGSIVYTEKINSGPMYDMIVKDPGLKGTLDEAIEAGDINTAAGERTAAIVKVNEAWTLAK